MSGKNQKKPASKFIQNESDSDNKQEEQQNKIDDNKKPASKFMVAAQSSEDEKQAKPQETKKKEEVDTKNKGKSKYAVNNSDEDEKKEVVKQETKPKSKFIKQSDSEEEVPKEKQKVQEKPKSKFIQQDDSEEEKPKQKQVQSKFLQQEDDSDEDQQDKDDQNEDQNEDKKKSKGQKKKEKLKKKEEVGGSVQNQDEKKEDQKKDDKKKDGGKKKNNIMAQKAQELLIKKKELEDKIREEEEAEKRKEEEEERQRLEKLRLEQEEKDRIQKEKDLKEKLEKEQGLKMTKKQRENLKKIEQMKQQQLQNLAKTGQIDIIQKIVPEIIPEIKKIENIVQTQVQPQSQIQAEKSRGKKKFMDPEEYKKQQEELKKKQEEEENQKKKLEAKQNGEAGEEEEDWEAEVDNMEKKEDYKHEEKDIHLESSGKKKKKSSVIEEDLFPKPKKGEKILRSPIICILGHVDTGKTTLLDKLRNTSVQEGEAGGITQQIGATFFPGSKISEEISKCESFYQTELKAPGILVIDTPGHESFSNLRSRGSGLCDFAILVIDLMHGLEKQTLESLQLLRDRKTPFVIALNKIDRCYKWKPVKFGSSYLSLQQQGIDTRDDFDKRYKEVLTQLNEQSFNVELFWKVEDVKTYIPIVPTSGVTGEGIPDILSVIVNYTSKLMQKKFVAKEEFNCTVMEVKMIEGHGTTIDCILIDGMLKRGDHIMILGFNGPIKTKIRAVLTPHPMKEMRVKGEYINHECIYAAMGVKIAAPGLEESVAGSALYLCNTPEEEEIAWAEVSRQLDDVREKVKLTNMGVGVAASTLGSLEALCMFLEQENIPVSYVTVGPVSKDDVQKAMKSLLVDDEANRRKEYAVMLVFDVKVRPEAQKYADENGVKVFTANIIYHLCKSYFDYHKIVQEERIQEKRKKAIFPCYLKIVQIFNQKNPIIMGVEVEKGTLRPGCPLCVMDNDYTKIGYVETIQKDKKDITMATSKTGAVAIRLKDSGAIQGGRHFTEEHKIISLITRDSIDCLKEFFKDQLTQEDVKLIAQLKKELKII